MESAYFDTIANTSRESVKAIEQLRYKYIISLAWVCRSIQASRQLRRFWLFMHEQALKRSRFPYSLSFEPEFEDSCAYLELPYSVETNFKAIPPRYARYSYAALPSSDHFRCFEILPGHWEDPLTGRLVVSHSNDDSEYEAISYTWGALPPSTLVTCESGNLAVTTNVAALLRRLRQEDRPRRLWIDSICINQDDHAEKSIQVTRMASIYSSCAGLIIWLGEEDKSTERAMEMLGILERVVDLAWSTSKEIEPNLQVLQESGLPDMQDSRWLDIQILFHNRWFTRMWILQEVSLAPKPRLCCGSFMYDWTKIVQIVMCLWHAQVPHFFGLKLNHTWTVCNFWYSRNWSRDSGLLNLLSSTRRCSSTLKVDRIFALLGLCAEKEGLQKLVKYPADGIEIQNDVRELYTAIANHFILKGNLTVLNLASDPTLVTLRDLPSWAPDWSVWCRAEPFIGHTYMNVVSESREVTHPPKVLDEGRTIVLRGRFIDRVRSGGRRIPVHTRVTDRFVALHLVKRWREIAGSAEMYNEDETMDEAFAKTVTINIPLQLLENEDYSDLYRRYISTFPQRTWLIPVETSDEHAISEFQSRMRSATYLRSFFKTKNNLIGMGPYCLRPSDHVVEFDGSSTPFAIRKTKNGRFYLIGDVYIHGWKSAGQSEWEDIYLV